MKKSYALVDCSCFYVSCERAFDPTLWRKPVVVLSNNDEIVVAASTEAKQIGIERGVAYLTCKAIVEKHQVRVRSSNYALYADMSKRVMSVLKELTPDVLTYSIDEAFVCFRIADGRERLAWLEDLRSKILQWTGIPTSIGCAPTKTLAKLASKIAKCCKNGVFDLVDNPGLEQVLRQWPVGDVWGIGHRYQKFLNRCGVTNAWQLTQREKSWIKKHLTIVGLRTALELGGVDCITLEEMLARKHNIICTRKFNRTINDLHSIEQAVATYTSRAAEKLRKQQSTCGLLRVLLMSDDDARRPRWTQEASHIFPLKTNYTPELVEQALACTQKLYDPTIGYRKAGVILSDLSPATVTQLDMITPYNKSLQCKRRRLMTAMDRVNLNYGSNCLQVASAGANKTKWHMRRQKLSPRFTTRWDEILQVKN